MKNIITIGLVIVALVVIIFLTSRNKKEKESPDVYIPHTAVTEKPSIPKDDPEEIDLGEEKEMK